MRAVAGPQSPAAWRLELALAALLGAAHSQLFDHAAAWPLQFVVLGLLAWRVAPLSPGRAALVGEVFGTAWLGCGTWWLYISLHRYGDLPAWMAVAAILALSAFLSIYLAAAMAAFARWRGAGAWRDATLFAALWLLAELARGVWFTGFPWLASGYAQIDAPLAAFAPWVGVYGMGALLAGLAAAPALAQGWRGRAAALALGGAVLGAAGLSGPGAFSRDAGSLSVSLLQGNVPQDEKFVVDLMPASLSWTRDHLLAATSELVVAPETVIPLLQSQLEPGYWESLSHHFARGGQAALFGLPLGDDEHGYTNSAVGLSAASATLPEGYYRYDKHHLVPFGEFIPRGFKWFTILMNIPLGDFNRGPVGPPSFGFHGQRIAANICFEDLFGEELAARFGDAANAPTLFANLSNLGWFGDSDAIHQHLQISRLRALEFQRPMLRATNTGATVVIDHRGRVVHALAPHTRGVLVGTVQGRDGLTPFAWWAARFGLAPLWVLAALCLLAAVRRRASRRL